MQTSLLNRPADDITDAIRIPVLPPLRPRPTCGECFTVPTPCGTCLCD